MDKYFSSLVEQALPRVGHLPRLPHRVACRCPTTAAVTDPDETQDGALRGAVFFWAREIPNRCRHAILLAKPGGRRDLPRGS